jgi:tRNA 2-thiouridine synthesizing protein A
VSSSQALTSLTRFAMYGRMTVTKLDLTGLKCPLPALKTRKALKALKPGDLLEVHCTDPLSVIDIPNLIRETGDKIEITERVEQQIVFLIEKADGVSPAVTGS